VDSEEEGCSEQEKSEDEEKSEQEVTKKVKMAKLNRDEFDITLVSNAKHSMSFYPLNTVASFTTRLCIPVELDPCSQYEIALKEIQFPISFYNVSNNTDYNLNAYMDILCRLNPEAQCDITLLSLPKGFYNNINQILRQINSTDFSSNYAEFTFNEITNRITMSRVGSIKLNLSHKLRSILGYNVHSDSYVSPGVAPNPVNLNANIPSQFFIHCDVVEPQLVGDSVERLLQVVGIEDASQFGQLFVQRFGTLEYVPLLKTSFQTIRIDIMTEEKHLAPFEFGPSLVKVNIRKRRFCE
jgi:hypothetical protein